MDDDRVDAHVLEQRDVLGKARLQLLVDHRLAAVLDDEGLAVEASDVGEGLEEDLRFARQRLHLTVS